MAHVDADLPSEFADGRRGQDGAIISQGLSNAEGNAFVDAVAAEYANLGIINNPTYNNLRGEIISEGADTAKALYNALGVTINALPEIDPVLEAAQLMTFREDRDNINDAIDRCDALIAAEPPGTVGRLVKEVLRDGKQKLREYKEQVRAEIQKLTGDPDS